MKKIMMLVLLLVLFSVGGYTHEQRLEEITNFSAEEYYNFVFHDNRLKLSNIEIIAMSPNSISISNDILEISSIDSKEIHNFIKFELINKLPTIGIIHGYGIPSHTKGFLTVSISGVTQRNSTCFYSVRLKLADSRNLYTTVFSSYGEGKSEYFELKKKIQESIKKQIASLANAYY